MASLHRYRRLTGARPRPLRVGAAAAQRGEPLQRILTRALRWSWAGLCLLLAACHVDMYQQPRYYPNDPSPFFSDGRANRPPVPNTVALSQFNTDPSFLTGKDAAGNLVGGLPATVEFNEELLNRGRTRFNAYCMPCHGMVGDGNGIIAQRGPLAVTGLHQQRLRDAPIGYFFDVQTNGIGRMYSYAARIPPEDRWAVAAYIRALQLSQNATIEDVPEEERANLE